MLDWDWTITLGDVAATVGLLAAATAVWLASRQMALDRRGHTFDYVTTQFDRLSDIGARVEIRHQYETKSTYASYADYDPDQAQRLLAYIYVLNRIGAGIFKGAPAEDVVFNIWPPRWFIARWELLEPFINAEKAQRGEEGEDVFVFFEWLAKEKCPGLVSRYPELKLRQRPRTNVG